MVSPCLLQKPSCNLLEVWGPCIYIESSVLVWLKRPKMQEIDLKHWFSIGLFCSIWKCFKLLQCKQTMPMMLSFCMLLCGVSRKECMCRIRLYNLRHQMKLPVQHLTLLSYYTPNSYNLSHHGNVEGTKGQLAQGMETIHQYLWRQGLTRCKSGVKARASAI